MIHPAYTLAYILLAATVWCLYMIYESYNKLSILEDQIEHVIKLIESEIKD